MLSLPNDWEFNMKDLQNRSTNGRDSTYKIMKELIEAGYVTRIEKRNSGKFGKVEYIVHETKQTPHTEKPETGNPYTEKPYPENPTLLNNNNTKNKLTNNVVVNAIQFYEENYGFLSPFIAQSIYQWVDDLGDELVIEAMKIALKKQKKWNYAEGILKDWAMNNVRTLYDVQTLEAEFRNKQNKIVRFSNRKRVVNGEPYQSNIQYDYGF
jgi:DnaD/phage-associated family protein